MRVVFIGSTHLGLRCLDFLSTLGNFCIAGVITNAETFTISYNPRGIKNVLYADFGNWASIRKVPLYRMSGNMKEAALKAWFVSRKPDLMVVVGWYHLIPKELRDIAPAYGLHASLLPDYSGGAPLVWAMINGEKVTGISLFRLDDGVDSGPILGQAETEIREDDTIATLYARIEEMGLGLVSTYLPKVGEGTAVLHKQDEKKRRIFPPRNPEDGRIDWSLPVAQVYNFIRAQTKPYPGAFSHLRGERMTIWGSRVYGNGRFKQAQGTLLSVDSKLLVVCGAGSALEILFLSQNGLDILGKEWVTCNKRLISSGVRFE